MRLDTICPVPPQIPAPARSKNISSSDREDERHKFQQEMRLCAKEYSIVLLHSVAKNIKNLRLSPYFLKPRPEKTPRPLHDLSFDCLSGPHGPTSINNCTDISALPELRIGTALPRLLAHLYSLSIHFPGQERVLWKFDLSGAFFLFHLKPSDCPYFGYLADAEGKLVVIHCRVMQGSKGGSHTCGALVRSIAEMVSSRSATDQSWIRAPPRSQPPEPPEDVRSTPQVELPFDPLYHHEELHPEHAHQVFDYIDDQFGAGLASMFTGVYRMHIDTIYSAVRGVFSSESSFRSCPISEDKFPEAAPTRYKDILGIIVDAHDLTVAIKPSRCTSTIAKIDALLSVPVPSNGQAPWRAKDVEQLVGILSFIASYRPRGRAHTKTLTNIISLCPVVSRRPRSLTDKVLHMVQVGPAEVQQLQAWRRYLNANLPVSIKLVVPRTPTHSGGSDAAGEAGTGAGGWHVVDGVAHLWRLEFPRSVTDALTRTAGKGTITICDLEFLAIVINIMMWVHSCRSRGLKVENLVLASVCDNLAAVSWLIGKGPASRAGLYLAQALDLFLSENGVLATSSHIPGVANVTADLLSRDFTMSPAECATMALHELAAPGAVRQGPQADLTSAVLLPLHPEVSHFASHFLSVTALLPRWESPPSPTISSLRLGYNSLGIFGVHPASQCSNLMGHPTPASS